MQDEITTRENLVLCEKYEYLCKCPYVHSYVHSVLSYFLCVPFYERCEMYSQCKLEKKISCLPQVLILHLKRLKLLLYNIISLLWYLLVSSLFIGFWWSTAELKKIKEFLTFQQILFYKMKGYRAPFL